jgi:glycosyltransferase involved in cell wall biosynthesis
MSKEKIVFVISDIDKALAFEWMALGLRKKFDLCFVLIGKANSQFSIFLKANVFRFYEISEAEHPGKLKKWFRLFLILKKEQPSMVHTHLWNANLLGLSAAWVLGIKKRIYTRHHAMIHYLQFPSGRKWDVLCNYLATHIVAIAMNTKRILIDLDKVDQNKITVIHHGFELDSFFSLDSARVFLLREKYKIDTQSYPVIGVISRYVEWKGLQYTIPAFRKIREQYPTSKLVLANAHGDYAVEIKKLLNTLPTDAFIEIKFEEDVASLYRLFDIHVHVPTDQNVEAFGQTYIEALACGIPSVFTLSGVAPEFIVHEQNALVVPFRDPEGIYLSMKRILHDEPLRNHLIVNGKKSAALFPVAKMIRQLEALYDES